MQEQPGIRQKVQEAEATVAICGIFIREIHLIMAEEPIYQMDMHGLVKIHLGVH